MADDMQYRIDMPYISGRTGDGPVVLEAAACANVGDHPDTVVGEDTHAPTAPPHQDGEGHG
jgi:hypothetical protein